MCFYWWSATSSQISLKFAFEKSVFFFNFRGNAQSHERKISKNGRHFNFFQLFFADNRNLTYSINGDIFIRKFYLESVFLKYFHDCSLRFRGNVGNQRPFLYGPPCTDCRIEPNTHCYDDKLCREYMNNNYRDLKGYGELILSSKILLKTFP